MNNKPFPQMDFFLLFFNNFMLTYFNVYCYVYIKFSLWNFQTLAVTVRTISQSIEQDNVRIT